MFVRFDIELDSLLESSWTVFILLISPDDLIRKNENEWKLNFSKSELNDEELIYSMIEFPKLMQRPIVVIGNKGVVARPVSLIEGLLE